MEEEQEEQKNSGIQSLQQIQNIQKNKEENEIPENKLEKQSNDIEQEDEQEYDDSSLFSDYQQFKRRFNRQPIEKIKCINDIKSEDEQEYDDSSLFSDQSQFKRRFNRQPIEKIEYMSQVTVERQRVYIRRENFLQTYSALMKYLDKLLKTELVSMLKMSEEFPQKRKPHLSESVQLISSYLKKVYYIKGLKNGSEVYKYLLERSINNEVLKLFGEQIFDHSLKKYPKYQKSFETEYSHQKGIINYFDPDIHGSLDVYTMEPRFLKLDLKLYCYKSMIYMKVLMTMYKKLLRLLFILEMIFNRLFGQSGRQIIFAVYFGFFYDQLSFKQEELDEMKSNSLFRLGQNKQIKFEYFLKENEDYYKVLLKQLQLYLYQKNNKVKIENKGQGQEQIKQENQQN